MSDSPFIKFYPSDFLGGTSGLSPAERGVYITLLCLIYEQDGPIQRDDARLARRCGAPKATFKRILSALILDGKITDESGALSNRRAEKALVDRQIRSQNATIAANKKWRAQREKNQEKQGSSDTVASATQYASDASQKPEPDTEVTSVTSFAAHRSKSPESEAAEPAPQKRTPRAARDGGSGKTIPDEWVPDQATVHALKDELDLTPDELRHCFNQMKDHAHAKGRRLKDWNAGYRQWVRKAAHEGEIGPGSRARKAADGALDALRDA